MRMREQDTKTAGKVKVSSPNQTTTNQPFSMSKLTFPIPLWEGFSPIRTEVHQHDLTIHLSPQAHGICRCGQQVAAIHDTSIRSIKEQPILDYQVTLSLPIRRLRCGDCGVVTEHIPWLKRFSRLTDRLVRHAEQLLELLPVKHVAKLTGLHWHTLKGIDKQRLERVVTEPEWGKVRRLVMDEFALFKGHRYATVIADADTHQVLWVGEGRSREAIRPFFTMLGEHCNYIEAVAMDMNTAFDLEVAMHCPNAEVVYDLFHVIAKYGREVIDRVRVDRANELKADKGGQTEGETGPLGACTGRIRSLIPLQSDHSFRSKPITDSVFIRSI
ncbi:ISL3 family transposase [Ferrimonas sediminicola]|uniref:ISL3 family transposase n=1 Tax=Ferrimonas sediminicola TaxID=2569538 RepID=A0A4U1BGZ8_9GAMM|nr:ISL3 family transposase [Ferrimonas sediminicola]